MDVEAPQIADTYVEREREGEEKKENRLPCRHADMLIDSYIFIYGLGEGTCFG